jgi:hypothetical protein
MNQEWGVAEGFVPLGNRANVMFGRIEGGLSDCGNCPPLLQFANEEFDEMAGYSRDQLRSPSYGYSCIGIRRRLSNIPYFAGPVDLCLKVESYFGGGVYRQDLAFEFNVQDRIYPFSVQLGFGNRGEARLSFMLGSPASLASTGYELAGNQTISSILR